MKTHILILLIVATNLFSVYANAQVNLTNNGQYTDPTFGVLELFDGTPLHLNRMYSDLDKLDIKAYVPLEGHYEWHTPLLIKKSKDGNSLIIQKGNMYTIELHKTNIPGTFKVPARFGNKDSRKRDISAKILADGSFQFSYTEKFPSRNVYNDEFYEI